MARDFGWIPKDVDKWRKAEELEKEVKKPKDWFGDYQLRALEAEALPGLAMPSTILPTLSKGLEYAFTPFSLFGEAQRGLTEGGQDMASKSRGILNRSLELQKQGVPDDERREILLDMWAQAFGKEPVDRQKFTEFMKDLLPGGATHEEYRSLPITEQLKYEWPAWLMAMGTGLSATGIRGALAPTAAKGGVRGAAAEVARLGLAPIAGYEKAVGIGLKYAIGVPMAGVKVSARKAFEKALDAGLDKWLVRQGIRGDQASKFIRFFLEKNKRWLYKQAEASVKQRLAQRLSASKAGAMAADDVVKAAEPRFDEVLKSLTGKELAVPTTPTAPITEVAPVVGAMSTNWQKIKGHNIARRKLLINPKTGKVTQGYRRLAEGITGKRSMLKMTSEEASLFIDALKKLPEPALVGGKRKPPTIPISKKVIPEGALTGKKYGQPTPLRWFTSQTYYAEVLGLGPLVNPLNLAKQRLDLEIRAMTRSIEQQIGKINRLGKTSLAEKLSAKTKNKPTKAVARMRDLLNKYEEPPAELSDKEREVFEWFRNLNRTIINGENAVRLKLDLDPIPYRTAYVRHYVAEGMAKEMLAGRYPFPESLKYWSKKVVGNKIFNPMELGRQLTDDLDELFTKDLEVATKAMVWTGLKEIHLSEPLKAFTEQMGVVTKDIPLYENLTMEELKEVRATSIMPASTRKWVIDYVNEVIKGQETQLDAEVNRIVTESGIGGLLNKVLKPFGKTIGRKPITKTFQVVGRLVIAAAIGPRPKLITRNLFQSVQNLALYTVKANLQGCFPVPENCKKLMEESLFLKGYTGYEDLPIGAMKKVEGIYHGWYQWSAAFNAHRAMKIAYWDTLELITDPKYAQYGWADPTRTYQEPKDFLYPSEKDALLREMEFGAGCTQYQYIPMGMPEVFRHKTLIPATRLQSWWMNYFTKFLRESTYRAFKGETTYGKKLPWSRRLGLLRYLIIGGAILSSLGYERSFLLGVFPSWVSPPVQLALGLYSFITADDDTQRERAKKQIFYSWKAFIPGSLAWQDFSSVWNGEKPLSSLFFYESEDESTRPTAPSQRGRPKAPSQR